MSQIARTFDVADRPDYSNFALAADTGRRQPMHGFDADYVDIVDYIVRCTHKIWEEKTIGLIDTHYAHNFLVHTGNGRTMCGQEAVVANTLQRISGLADCRLYADDLIWSGDETDGFYTSHRLYTVGRHTGHTALGPPTGRLIAGWGVADCRITQNRIVEGWVTGDGRAEVRQMGLDPLALAKRAVLPATPHTHGELDRLPTGQQSPVLLGVPSTNDDPQAFVSAVLHNIWNARLINMVREHYAPGQVAFVPDTRKLDGHGDYENFVITLLACFPDLALTVGHQGVLGDEKRGHRVAARFTLQGTHEGYGPYGAPTGRRFLLIGMSHHTIQGGQIVKEGTVFDEFELFKQLYGQVEA